MSMQFTRENNETCSVSTNHEMQIHSFSYQAPVVCHIPGPVMNKSDKVSALELVVGRRDKKMNKTKRINAVTR